MSDTAYYAQAVISAIEGHYPEYDVGRTAQDLARALGGLEPLDQMTPGAAALYLIALHIRHEAQT